MWDEGTNQDYEPGQPDEAPKAITQTKLRERGWTDKMVRELLGEPDERRENTSYPGRPPMRLYLLERIEEAERTDAFFELLDKSEKRKEVAGKASQKAQKTRLAKTTSLVEGLEINLPKLEAEELVRLGCERYNAWLDEEELDERPRATPQDSPYVRNFVSVQYLLRSVEGYQELHDSLLKQVGAREGRRRLNERIYQAIALMYPDLARMCEQQNKRKLFPSEAQKLAREKAAAARKARRKGA